MFISFELIFVFVELFYRFLNGFIELREFF